MRRLATASLVALTAMLASCERAPSLLEHVLTAGELVVVTRNSATTYYEGPMGATGLEYDLATAFADHLGVELTLLTATTLGEMLSLVTSGQAHIAAGGLTVTDERRKYLRFGPAYQEITQQLVYRKGTPRPQSLDDLGEGRLEVVGSSSHAERLRELAEDHPELNWLENGHAESEELLTLVWERVIDYTVADSHELALNQRFYPELRAAFDLTGPQQLAWGFPMARDRSLYDRATQFFEQIRENGELARLKERHYGHIGDFDYVGTRVFLRHVGQRLPRYRDLFEQGGRDNDLDWRLLAAMGYQESHWDPRAVSPTGVRGIMMLTQATARDLGVERRTDPRESILGGARYYKRLHQRIAAEVPEPDRTWMALAAYNVGLGHLNDARELTARRGGDPNRWVDVKESLPLLRQRAWYSQTRHGYARGNEALVYVENIRSYYEMLSRLKERGPVNPMAAPPGRQPLPAQVAAPAI